MKKYELMIVRAFFLGIFGISCWTLLEVVNLKTDVASIKMAIEWLSKDSNHTASK